MIDHFRIQSQLQLTLSVQLQTQELMQLYYKASIVQQHLVRLDVPAPILFYEAPASCEECFWSLTH